MAGLRELKKRLKSIRTTGQIAGAMRTAAAARFSRVNAALIAYRPYNEACEAMLRHIGCTEENAKDAPEITVLMASNRGLCGGFNGELFAFFKGVREADGTPPRRIVTCGRMAELFLAENGFKAEKSFKVSDVPTFEEASALAEYLKRACDEGSASRVVVVMEKFVNTLCQTPESRVLFPLKQEQQDGNGGCALEDDVLYLPDKASISKHLVKLYFEARVYGALLENAAGAQAATLMAMRQAYDNAASSAAELETAINRRRQAEVTASVLETADEGNR